MLVFKSKYDVCNSDNEAFVTWAWIHKNYPHVLNLILPKDAYFAANKYCL